MADFPVLTTPRLRLRRLSTDDAGAMAALLDGDSEAIQQTSHIPDPCTVEGARAWIELRSAGHPFAIEAADGTFLGAIGAVAEGEVAGLGYWLGRAHWGQGLATEALSAVLGFLGGLGVRRVEADAFTSNPASARVLVKCGFVYRDSVEEAQPVRGGVKRIDRYAWTGP